MRKRHKDLSPEEEFERSVKALELRLGFAGAGQGLATPRAIEQAFQSMESAFEALDDGTKAVALVRFSSLQQRCGHFAGSRQNAMKPLDDFRL